MFEKSIMKNRRRCYCRDKEGISPIRKFSDTLQILYEEGILIEEPLRHWDNVIVGLSPEKLILIFADKTLKKTKAFPKRGGSQNPRMPRRRHTSHQIKFLEEFFKRCAHPNERQRRQLGVQLGLESSQIKYWFQNKRTHIKAQNKRADIGALRSEYDRLQSENATLKEALKRRMSRPCGMCGGGPVANNETIDKLQQEKNVLMCEYAKMASFVAENTGILLSSLIFNKEDTITAGLESGNPTFHPLVDNIDPKNLNLADRIKTNSELEKVQMTEIAASAMNELIKLLRVDQPLLVKSQIEKEHVLAYDKGFSMHNPRMESSKDSGVIAMDARFLVDLYLNAVSLNSPLSPSILLIVGICFNLLILQEKWVDVFPAVFSKVKTVNVVRAGMSENCSGSLQLIHEQMLVVSPLVQQREFYLLRYCLVIEPGTWVIADVSYNSEGGSHVSPTCWKHPSGCLIEQMPNGLSRVTCIERVEVDDNSSANPIYEHLFKSNLAFGATRWISTLQRTCERYSFLKEAEKINDTLGTGRSSMIILASKLIKSYYSMFSSKTSSFCQISEQTNITVQIGFRNTSSPYEPVGTVIQAISTFWVPASPETVLSYLNDNLVRSQWDALCLDCNVSTFLQIPTGHHPLNAISILQPGNSREDLLIFQESTMGPVESTLIYAAVDSSSLLELATGLVSPTVPILASGFVITRDGPDMRHAPSTSSSKPWTTGSMVTAAFQLLSSCSPCAEERALCLAPKVKALAYRAVTVVRAILNQAG